MTAPICPPFPSDWIPNMIANLAFMVDKDSDRILLIHKKTGLGKGKINGPGGKLEPGETALESAVRELQEELHITPTDLEEMGVIHFQFAQGLALHCTVFKGYHFEGTPTETREAKPEWFSLDEIPYQRMWADDIFWLPGMLADRKFNAWFHFDEEVMTGSRIDWKD